MIKKDKVNHDTVLVRLGFKDSGAVSGLTTASCLLLKAPIGSTKEDGSRKDVTRPYTPTSDPETRCVRNQIYSYMVQNSLSLEIFCFCGHACACGKMVRHEHVAIVMCFATECMSVITTSLKFLLCNPRILDLNIQNFSIYKRHIGDHWCMWIQMTTLRGDPSLHPNRK